MKAQFVKHRPKYNYVGAHVVLKHGDRDLLGTIVYICPDEHLCQVRHFNGEMWPINPSLSRLEILERTYEGEDHG
jgi:hypothetical protein